MAENLQDFKIDNDLESLIAKKKKKGQPPFAPTLNVNNPTVLEEKKDNPAKVETTTQQIPEKKSQEEQPKKNEENTQINSSQNEVPIHEDLNTILEERKQAEEQKTKSLNIKPLGGDLEIIPAGKSDPESEEERIMETPILEGDPKDEVPKELGQILDLGEDLEKPANNIGELEEEIQEEVSKEDLPTANDLPSENIDINSSSTTNSSNEIASVETATPIQNPTTVTENQTSNVNQESNKENNQEQSGGKYTISSLDIKARNESEKLDPEKFLESLNSKETREYFQPVSIENISQEEQKRLHDTVIRNAGGSKNVSLETLLAEEEKMEREAIVKSSTPQENTSTIASISSLKPGVVEEVVVEKKPEEIKPVNQNIPTNQTQVKPSNENVNIPLNVTPQIETLRSANKINTSENTNLNDLTSLEERAEAAELEHEKLSKVNKKEELPINSSVSISDNSTKTSNITINSSTQNNINNQDVEDKKKKSNYSSTLDDLFIIVLLILIIVVVGILILVPEVREDAIDLVRELI